MLQITVFDDGKEIRRFDLPARDTAILVGRHSTAGVVLTGSGVSRQHAYFHCRADGTAEIEDAGSSAGTEVNGEKISGRIPVHAGDWIGIGNFQLRVNSASTPAASPKPKAAAAPAAIQSNNFLDEFKDASLLYSDEIMALSRKIHADVLVKLNMSEKSLLNVQSDEVVEKVTYHLENTLKERQHEIPGHIPLPLFKQALMDEFIGFGPISPLLRSSKISEIMINGPNMVFVESRGRIYESGVRFYNHQHLLSILQRIVEPLGRHVDEASPMVDARLPDGSRVNAVIPPLALDGISMTIRKFADKRLTGEDLVGFGSATYDMMEFLQLAVENRMNILVSGGTGSGKTTLLNILSQFIPSGERVITIEDSAELKLTHKDVVRLEARPANIEGKGRISIRDLVINTLRMRPDRIIVGECRGAEALDMLQAMNTGHDGSLTTCHANNPRDALARLENMVMMAGFELPSSAIREQISSAINLIVQQSRLSDGSRKIVNISEVTGREGDQILLQDIFTFQQKGIGSDGKCRGYFTATGNIPVFIGKLREKGASNVDMSIFVPKEQ